MLSELGMTFEGREHCGLDDSKNIARIVIRMLEDRSELRVNCFITYRAQFNDGRGGGWMVEERILQ